MRGGAVSRGGRATTAGALRRRGRGGTTGHPDWIWLCLLELWRRWWPERVCVEFLGDKIQEGYDALERRETVPAAATWLDASDRFRLGAALRASGPADIVPVGSDHPARGAGTIGFVTERSSGGDAPGSSSWAKAQARPGRPGLASVLRSRRVPAGHSVAKADVRALVRDALVAETRARRRGSRSVHVPRQAAVPASPELVRTRSATRAEGRACFRAVARPECARCLAARACV